MDNSLNGVSTADKLFLSGKWIGQDTSYGMVVMGEIQMQYRLQKRP
jgi:hypothetical protein